MSNTRLLTLLLALIFIAPAHAQKVYKCKGPDGTSIYAQRPCATNVDAMTEIDVKAMQPPSDVDTSRVRDISRGVARSQLAIDEATCIDNTVSGINRESSERVARLERQIYNLRVRAAYTNNNLAGATLEAGLRKEIGSLQEAIALERMSANSQATAARASCVDDRKRKEDAIVAREAREDGIAAPAIEINPQH